MDNFTVTPFIPGEIHLMNLRPYEKSAWSIEEWTAYAEMSNAVTVRENGVILCVAGYIPQWKGVIDVFVIPSTDKPANPLAYCRMMRAWLDNLKFVLQLHRLQTISIDDPETDKWMRVLGFKHESTLYEYRPDRLNCKVWTRGVESGN